MTPQREAMIWGAVAALVTVVAETLFIDPTSLFKDFDTIAFLGYCVKGLILMGLGAIMVRVNQEVNIQKAFQLGLIAPVLIIGMQSGASLDDAHKQLSAARQQLQELQVKGSTAGSTSPTSTVSKDKYLALINAAHAEGPIPKGEHRNVSILKRFWYGLTGSLDQGWFVIAGSHKDRTDAEKQASMLRNKDWNVKIGEAYAWGGYYSVLLGSYLSKEKAMEIRDLAIKDGLPKDTYVWRR